MFQEIARKVTVTQTRAHITSLAITHVIRKHFLVIGWILFSMKPTISKRN